MKQIFALSVCHSKMGILLLMLEANFLSKYVRDYANVLLVVDIYIGKKERKFQVY